LKLDEYNKEHGTSLTKLPANPKDVAKRQKTMMERYGTIMPMNDNPESVKKKEKTSMEKYGVKNAAHAPSVRKKAQNTMKSRSKEEKQITESKKIKTMLENHGVENPMQSEKISNKAKQTRLERYGVEHVLQNPKISAKQVETMKNTLMEKYGVEAISHVPEFAEKMNNPYYNKTYVWKTGEEITLQGYEDIVLLELEEKGYTFNDVLTNKKDMPELIYEFEGKSHRYYPDFFIPSENLIIEVKSDWTLKKFFDKNQAKFNAVKAAGFDFRLEVR
jgi:hypothetical protein